MGSSLLSSGTGWCVTTGYLIFGCAGLCGRLGAAPIYAGTPGHASIEVRLLTKVSSYHSKKGDPVKAAVVLPVSPNPTVTFPEGTIVRGMVKSVHRVGLGIIHETARMDLEFNEIELASGETAPIQARVVSVENAREHVDRRGRIHGIRATSSLSNRLGERIMLEVTEHPMGLVPLFLLESMVFRFPDPEINYPAGTELHLELDGDLPISSSSGRGERTSDLATSEALETLVGALPYWSYSERNRPMDPTNVIFIGGGDAVVRAFAASGWTDSRSLSPRTGLGVIRAIAEDHGYLDAPMRRLLLDGRMPDMYRQKGLNDFEKRDHVRVWKRTEEFEGTPVWAAAATRDIAATFSFRLGFTHRIENDLDLERDKIVTDFVHAGCVDEVAYIERPSAILASEAGLRKGLTTDGRVAVLVLNSCDTAEPEIETAAADGQPGLAVRYIRRITLTARNHFLRDNLAWRSGEAAVLAFRAARSWRRGRAEGRMMRWLAANPQYARGNSAWVVAPPCEKAATTTGAAAMARRGPA